MSDFLCVCEQKDTHYKIVSPENRLYVFARIRRETNRWNIRCDNINEDLESLTRAKLVKLGNCQLKNVLDAFSSSYEEVFG